MEALGDEWQHQLIVLSLLNTCFAQFLSCGHLTVGLGLIYNYLFSTSIFVTVTTLLLLLLLLLLLKFKLHDC